MFTEGQCVCYDNTNINGINIRLGNERKIEL